MDFLAHGLYGATLCSRTGLAGGRRGAGCRWTRDWTVWAGLGFGVLPDLVSPGVPFLCMLLAGEPPSFSTVPPAVFQLYHFSHSLLTAAAALLLLRLLARPLVVPALAWPLHIVADAISHGPGHWQTLLFHPLWDWRFDGIDWWRHPGVMLSYWMLLPLLWAAVAWQRRSRGQR